MRKPSSCCGGCGRSDLKEGIGLRGYGQRDPLVEYKKESFELFQDMKARIDEETVKLLWRLRPVRSERRHRPSRLWPARSARRVQERELRAVPGHEGAHR